MKKLIFAISTALLLVSCSKPVQTETTITSDSLMIHVLQAIIDTNRSCVDVQDEFFMLLDTMQEHVEFYPDEDIRIGAKSFAMDLGSLFMEDGICSPDEVQFFLDSLILRLSDIQSTWYRFPYDVSKKGKEAVLMLSQNIVFRYGEDNENHVISLDLYSLPDGKESMVITLPEEAQSFQSIMFNGEDMRQIDTSLYFDYKKAIHVLPETEENNESIFFGSDLIEAMLSHDGMFVGYIGDEETDEILERYHDAHLMLDKFHEQYNSLEKRN